MLLILLISYLFFVLPVACFLVALVTEILAYKEGTGFLLRMIEIALGIVVFLAIPTKFGSKTFLSRAAFSWTMVCVSLLMVLLALVSKYTSRVALSSVLAGSSLLACLWYFNGAYHP